MQARQRKRLPDAERPTVPKPPVCQRYVISDTTVEALAERLSHAPRGLADNR